MLNSLIDRKPQPPLINTSNIGVKSRFKVIFVFFFFDQPEWYTCKVKPIFLPLLLQLLGLDGLGSFKDSQNQCTGTSTKKCVKQVTPGEMTEPTSLSQSTNGRVSRRNVTQPE